MPEWWIERGIGETRAALVEDGEIVEARIYPDGVTQAGTVLAARLANTGAGGRNAIAVAEGGSEYLLPRGAPGATQGETHNIEVTRSAIPGSEPWKRPLARVTDKPLQVAPPLEGRPLAFPSPDDELGKAGWNDLIDEARTGVATFAGGELRISSTPAMTLIDVDGFLPPEELAILGSSEAAKAILRLDVGGSIGIDLPTIGAKAARQEAGAAIDAALPRPFERTAVNGFGFVQIVRPRQRPSLVELAQDRAAFEARDLLRKAGRETGAIGLVAHPAVISLLENRPDWIDQLARHVGGEVSLRADANIPISGGYATSR